VGKASLLVSLRGWPGRILLAAAGFAIIAFLVRSAGPERVLHVLLDTARWFPLIAALEVTQTATDIFAVRMLLGDARRNVPLSAWVRSSAVAYAMMTLLPAGRAAGEVGRAAILAKYVGTPPAANASARLSVAFLSGNAVASAAAFVAVTSWFGFGAPMSLLLGANVLLVAASAGSLLAITKNARVGRWLDKMRRRFASHEEERPSQLPPEASDTPWRAIAACLVGRCAQLTQYGVILAAVGGAPSVRGAFVAQGIHLVGATLGDLFPNQLGVVDGVYRTFAPVLGLGAAPERALSIAFVVHTTQLSIAGVCVLVAALTRKDEPREGAPSSARAGAHS
jgi:hypothetical protein